VTLEASAAAIRLVVADDGPGVLDAERELIVRRFFRSERCQGTPGVGLGLSLVKAIADLHQARMSVEDNRPGLRICIELAPARAEASSGAARGVAGRAVVQPSSS
jgi:signal transduction histidine kinase